VAFSSRELAVIEQTMSGHGEAGPPEAADGTGARVSRWPRAISTRRQLRRERPVQLAQPLTPAAKVRLATEIVRIYVPTRARIACNRLRLLEQVKGLPVAQAPSRSSQLSPGRKSAQAARLGSTVERTLDLLPTDSSCLTRSVVLARLLSRRGIESSLVIGVGSDGDSFIAHAWVEHRGIPLLDPGRDDLTRLVQLDVLNDHKHRWRT
jgi:Transglutaminase-like superfamily